MYCANKSRSASSNYWNITVVQSCWRRINSTHQTREVTLVLSEGLLTTKPPLIGIGWFVHVIYPEHWQRCLGYQDHTPHHTILFPEHSSKHFFSRDHRTAWSNYIQLQRPSFTNPEIRYIPLRKATIWDKIIHHLTLLYRSIQTRKSPACARWAWKELCLFWHRSGGAL